jgi:hypothetical protein
MSAEFCGKMLIGLYEAESEKEIEESPLIYIHAEELMRKLHIRYIDLRNIFAQRIGGEDEVYNAFATVTCIRHVGTYAVKKSKKIQDQTNKILHVINNQLIHSLYRPDVPE